MLQELAARTGSAFWVVASMFFFIGIWVWIAVRVVRTRSEDMDAWARLALDGAEDGANASASNAETKAFEAQG